MEVIQKERHEALAPLPKLDAGVHDVRFVCPEIRSPSGTAPTQASIELSLNGQQFHATNLTIRLYEASSLTAVVPCAAPTPSGSSDGTPMQLKLKGHGFLDVPSLCVQITSVFRDEQDGSSSDEEGHLPSGAVGSNAAGASDGLPRISSLSSMGGVNSTTRLVPVTYVSDTTLALAVPLPAGRYGLRVCINGQHVEGSEVVFSSYQEPVVSQLTSSIGFVKGGAWVGIRGGPFVDTGVVVLRFTRPDGSVLADVNGTIMGNDYVGCTTPPAVVAEEVHVSVSLNGETFHGALPYQYLTLPEASAPSPSVFKATGGTMMSIKVTNMPIPPSSDQLAVMVREVIPEGSHGVWPQQHVVQSVTMESVPDSPNTSIIKFHAPAVGVGAKPFAVLLSVNGGEDFALSVPGTIMAHARCSLHQAVPRSCSMKGGIRVRLHGTGMMKSERLAVRFVPPPSVNEQGETVPCDGEEAMPIVALAVELITASLLEAVVPSVQRPGLYKVEVRSCDDQFVWTGAVFLCVQCARVVSLVMFASQSYVSGCCLSVSMAPQAWKGCHTTLGRLKANAESLHVESTS